jgi:CHAD domain-containing protein
MKKRDVSLRADEPIGAGVLRIAEGLIHSVTDSSKQPTGDWGEYVHTVRTTIKQLRALLRMIRPATGESFFESENARLRGAARRLAFARDKDVARETLKNLAVSGAFEQKAVAAALAGLASEIDPPEDVVQALSEVRQDLEQTRRNLQKLQLAESDWQVIETGLQDVYRQSRKRMNTALLEREDEAFHKWRIRVKNLYYELQMLEPVWPKRLDKMTSRLAKLQDKIGRDHDIVMLKGLLRKTPEAFGGAETVERVIRCLEGKSQKLRRAVEPLSKSIFEKKPRRFVRTLGRRWNKWRE